MPMARASRSERQGVLLSDDGSSWYLLPAARALSRAGFRVGVAAPVRNRRCLGSTAIDRWHPARVPEASPEGFLDDVAAAVRVGDYQVVFPTSDIELLVLSAGRGLVPALLPYPAHEVVLRAVDKLRCAQAAIAAGLAVPWTAAAAEVDLADAPLPVMVKAALHWTPGVAASRAIEVRLCSTRAELTSRVAELEASGRAALLQEPITGEQVALSVVLDRGGDVVALVQQLSLRSSSRHTSVRAVTTPPDPSLTEPAVALLRSLGWFGLANLQFLIDPDGRGRLIDFNGRFYGSLALAIAAGADLPGSWARLAVGLPVQSHVVGRPGVRFQSLEEDLLLAWRSRQFRAAAEACRFALGAAHSTFDPRDPLPALGRAAWFARRLGAATGARLG